MTDASDEAEKGAEPPIQETEGEGQRQSLPDGESRGYLNQGERGEGVQGAGAAVRSEVAGVALARCESRDSGRP